MDAAAAASAVSGAGECGGTPGSSKEKERDTQMDAFLRSRGLCRKRIAKDGSCLFRAVAEQVFHSQSEHFGVRKACVSYLRRNRENFEAFIEGSFEEYLRHLENPQEWVGEVEISALSLMYKHDFVIYQEPDAPPSYVTENGFPDKVQLCFSNGNHYDLVYEKQFTNAAALCQSILYEMLYEKVLSVEVGDVIYELSTNDGKISEAAEEHLNSSGESDIEDDVSQGKVAKNRATNRIKFLTGNQIPKSCMNNDKSVPLSLPRKVLQSLNPSVYRNVEYDVWIKSKREQQKMDYSIAASMQYSVGDKCKVRLDHNGECYNAHIQEVSPENGPVVVFVEDLGEIHTVFLKNLEPLAQEPAEGGWNTVSGKKVKKSFPASKQNFHPETDYKGQKPVNKTLRMQPKLPPRLQSGTGGRPHHLPCQYPGPQSPTEHKTASRTPPQTAKRPDRERGQESDYASSEGNYFGLSPGERQEKQAREESQALYEIQRLDEEAFPALSSPSVSQAATQTNDICNQRKPSNQNHEKKSLRWQTDSEEKDKDANLKHAKSELRCEQNTLVNKNVNGASEPIKTQTPGSTEQAPSKVLPAAVSFGANSTAPLSVDSHPSSVPSPPPSVPSVPTVVPSQPNEPILCRPAGVPFQVTTSIAPAAAGPTVSMTQVISSPIAPLPVPVHPVNQPQMPLPQTLTPYQDLLYPGFPLNEKGECVSIPPYSYSKSGDDLPKDKGILQFFFNLGIKAYSCPMWAPHSYLYPLHQAYLNACRMYSSKVSSPVCHSGPWFQAPSSTPREASAVPVQMGGDLPHANEARLNGQYIDGGHGLASQSPEAAQSQGHQGSLDHSVSDPMQHSHMQPSHSGTGENSVLEERFLQPAFGHTPFIGGFQVAPAFTPPFWLGYPMQPFHEGMVAHNLRTYTEHEPKVADCPTVAPVDGDQCIASIPVDGTILQHQEGYSGEPSSSGSPTATGVDAQGEHNFVPSPSLKMKPEVESPVASRQQSQPSVGQVNETESAALSSAALDAGGSTTSIKKTGVPCVEGTDEPKDLQSTCKPESRVPVCKEELPKAESSEDEREVSEMLNRGRNKYYYSQNYVGRRGRNEKGHPFGRSGYPNSRAEEGRRGAQSKGMFYRDRDENRQSQHFRERGDARWKSREMYKAGKNVDRQWNFQK
ncbi:OTU domain-containing protein 4 isoform X2 [Latimeria chalumnae]|uniref:OTU domain-containing protein 4 isoform X2 n=1 Tax=Latimeria chalumnae TaxID=7897 RepID=UPI00313BA80C